jgi:excisionase family DNA binding protein
MKPLPDDMTVADMAALTQIPERTLQHWCQSGDIPARRIGLLWRIKVNLLCERNPDLYEELLEKWAKRYAGKDTDPA